ncbi:MAG: hypothetical protein Q7U71_09345 [bacterium]|nr:hypothetical protein [bacterium]
MRKFLIITMAAAVMLSAGCCRQGLGNSKPFKLKLSQLTADQEKYADKLIAVKGELSNAGANYFTDLKVTLSDGQGNSIRVQPWLPISVPPPRPGGPRNRPALISDYLGKTLRLVGKWVKQDEGFILQVEKAEPAE